MNFFITAVKICHTRIRPTQMSGKIFSVDSSKFVIKELGGQPNPPWGRVLPDGIYNVTFYRVWFSSMQLSLGLGIGLDRLCSQNQEKLLF